MTDLIVHSPPPAKAFHDAGEELTRMTFALPPNAWHGYASEGLWVQPTANDEYVLLNSPFFVHNVSHRDVVTGDTSSGLLRFVDVLRRGRHSTYRVIPNYATATQPFLSLWRELENFGCTYEEAKVLRLLSVDVPARADIYAVYDILERGVAAEVWDFQEGHCGHPLQK